MYCSKCGVPNNDEAKFCKDCGNALGVQQNTTVTQAVLPASLVQRFVHNIVDSIAMYIFAFAIGFLAIAIFGEDVGLIIGFIAFFAYHLIFEAIFQKTIGKMFTGTKVVSVTGEKPSFLALLGRTFARYIPFEPLSFLFYGSYPTMGWHDRLSGTLVVPKSLTPEQVKSIDQKKINEQKLGNSASIILVIVVGGFFFIAVIGILASVVLASLNTARDKGEDASVKATLSSARAQAELYYNGNNNSYNGFCLDTKTKTLFVDKEYTCHDNSTEYAITSQLNEGGYFCVDSLGTAEVVTDEITYDQTSCDATSGDLNSNTEPVTLYEELKEAEEYAKSLFKLPAMVDEETRLERIYASTNNKMNYDYSLINYSANVLEWTALEEIVLPTIQSSFCTDTSFEFYRSKNVPMVWNYYDMNKVLIGSIELTTKDCI